MGKIRWSFVGAAIALQAFAPLAIAAELVGVTSVVDGDTIEIHGARIFGIDAPESTQLCREATA
jgi:endonuclease YncB( thermonuclease family)